MKKILFILLFLSSLLFPISEVSAACFYCATGVANGSGQCGVMAARGAGFTPATRGCPSDKQASIADINSDSCQCVDPGTAGATGPTGTGPTAAQAASKAVGVTPPPLQAACDPKKDVDCTSAKGKRCDTTSGIDNPDGTGVMSAIGCLPTEPKALIEGLLRYGTFAAGGIAFLIMIFASLQMITAEGNPQSIKGAQEKFYSAIIGLLLVIFSVLLMQVIGVDVLGLPGFGR